MPAASTNRTPDVAGLLAAVRRRRPLVHHITNWVTISECADLVRAFGAAPVMAHAVEEVADMVGLADALVLNIGTIDTPVLAAMIRAAVAANEKGIPVVLDACGAGATPFRDRVCQELLDAARLDVLKGNASEVARLAGIAVRTRGVDSGTVTAELNDLARTLAQARHLTVVITGKEDVVAGADGTLWRVANGHPLMGECVGTGCMAASAIGAFAAVAPKDLPAAAAAGLAAYEIAGELAAAGARGPADFKQRLLDAVHALTPDQVTERSRILAAR